MISQSYVAKQSYILWKVAEKIPVYDCYNHPVGKVKYVRFPSELAEEEGNRGEYSLAHLTKDNRRRLLREGFIQVDAGLACLDYYVLPGQIIDVSNKRIVLEVMKGELIHF